MCLIIHNPLGNTIDPEIVEIALTFNADGFGIFYHDTGKVVRTMCGIKASKLCAEPRPFTAHFRYATSGKTGKKQCHPFKIDDRYVLMQNGTVEHLRSATEVDTARLAKVLSTLPPEHWLTLLETHPCRFAVCDTKTGDVMLANEDLWHEHEGSYYSKREVLDEYEGYGSATRYYPAFSEPKQKSHTWDNWADDWETRQHGRVLSMFDDELDQPADPEVHDDEEPEFDNGTRHTVAVYGTLKQGHHNHSLRLSNAAYLGSGRTADLYPLVVNCLPYLLDKKGTGHHVEVEVYSVTDAELRNLDGLEGHPDWYQRRIIPIKLDQNPNKQVAAWVYLMPDMRYDTGVYQDSY